MLHLLLTYGIPLVAGFGGGLLVGRKNPSVATKAAILAEQAQAAIKKL